MSYKNYADTMAEHSYNEYWLDQYSHNHDCNDCDLKEEIKERDIETIRLLKEYRSSVGFCTCESDAKIICDTRKRGKEIDEQLERLTGEKYAI